MRATVFGPIVLEMASCVPAPPQPGRVVQATRHQCSPGGRSAAQATHLRDRGCETLLVGALGADAAGDLLRSHLERRGIDVSAIKVLPGAQTGVCMRYRLPSGESAGIDGLGANAVLSADWIPDAALKQSDFFLSQLAVPADQLQAAAVRARANGCMVVVDAHGFTATRLFATGHFDWLSADAPEFARLCEAWSVFGVDPLDRCRLLAERLVTGVACYLGREGSVACLPSGQVVAVPGTASSSLNGQHGALFGAAFALALCSAAGLKAALQEAHLAAAGKPAPLHASCEQEPAPA